ncbi:hypothetical protein D1007_49189 [Hordeum vulgare]|nr:hypothetical protein D1007_49189 [Hordeum vulgare]
MPSWNDGDESSDDDSMVVSLMDMEYFDTRDTIPEPLFRGAPMEEVPKCTLHEMMPRKTFDWRDGIGKMDYHKAMDARKYEKKKEELEMEMKIEKLRLERSRSVS